MRGTILWPAGALYCHLFRQHQNMAFESRLDRLLGSSTIVKVTTSTTKGASMSSFVLWSVLQTVLETTRRNSALAKMRSIWLSFLMALSDQPQTQSKKLDSISMDASFCPGATSVRCVQVCLLILWLLISGNPSVATLQLMKSSIISHIHRKPLRVQG